VAKQGRVDIVGAGPGSVAFLTVQARALLEQAEVVVYDALVDGALQTLTPSNCEWVNVGKRGGGQSTPQAEIDQLLVRYCQAGKRVVRLKSGDPFVFGRTASEIEALKAARCAFTVVPGLSSALAAPLFASISLTDPVLSRCLAIATAHEPDALNWEALSQIDTLVLLMGGRQLAEIVHQLERHGRSPDTAIAVIRWAGQPEQQIWTGTLKSIVQQTARQSLSPCVIVIGEVVRLRPYLQPDIDSDSEPAASHPFCRAIEPIFGTAKPAGRNCS
jgi:uroporphyrin-III C-methyltransferase